MTLLTRPLRRETAVYYRNRALVVELHPHHLTLREKGRRFSLDVDYRAILDLAYKQLARAAAADKAAARKSKPTTTRRSK